MRLWLNDDERRPDPAPARADARKALVAGTAGWALALVASYLFADGLADAGLGWLAAASWVGLTIGLVGLIVVQAMRMSRGRRRDDDVTAGQDSSG